MSLTVLCAAGAALGNVAGGALIVTKFRRREKLLTQLVAFGGGFMLAAALLKMVPASMALSANHAPAMFLIGYFATHFFEHVLGEHIHLGDDPHDPHCGHCAHDDLGALTVVGLCVHALFDGVAIASGFAVSASLGVLMFVAVLLHKIPEGSTVASVVLQAGHSGTAAMAASLTLAAATLIGSLAMAFAPPTLIPYGLPFATGVTIHVAASDLIPEVNELRGVRMALVVIAGAVTFWVTEVALGRFGL